MIWGKKDTLDTGYMILLLVQFIYQGSGKIQKNLLTQNEETLKDFSNSLHIYGNTISEVKDMLNRMKNKGELPEEIIKMMEKEEKSQKLFFSISLILK